MKKWQVLAAALLLAIIGAARLLRDRASVPEGGLAGFHMLPEGVPLPKDTTQYYIPEEFLSVPPQTGAPSSYGPLPTIKNEAYDRGLCEGGSLNEILSSHGRIWGRTARHGAFTSEASGRTYRLLSRYLACVALSRRDTDFCDYLPSGNESLKIPSVESPNSVCREMYSGAAFPFFMAGRADSDSACRMTLAVDRGGLRPAPIDELCGAASKGMENLCGTFSKRLDKKGMAECLRFAPAKEKDCGGDKACLARLAVYKAMKAGDASACPEESRGFCEALLSGTEAACSVMLVRLGTEYCADLADAQKKAGGLAGLSPEEVKEAIALKEQRKAEDEAMRKEMRRIEDEVNKRVRRLLGKDGDGDGTGETDRR